MTIEEKNNLTPSNQNTVIADIIKRLGIAQIKVTFDGCGDSGQIEEICALNASDDEIDVDFRNIQVGKVKFTNGYQYNPDGTCTPVIEIRESNFEEVIENICYSMLEKSHGGWEINEGSYGTFTFDFSTGKIHLEYNERVTSVETSELEFDFGINQDQASVAPAQLTDSPDQLPESTE